MLVLMHDEMMVKYTGEYISVPRKGLFLFLQTSEPILTNSSVTVLASKNGGDRLHLEYVEFNLGRDN